MKLNNKVLLTSFCILIFTVPVFADMFTPSVSCYKPSKAFEFTSQWQIDSFNNDVQTYKNCIEDFVDDQNEAINNHQEAADDAIDEWNRFVNYELN